MIKSRMAPTSARAVAPPTHMDCPAILVSLKNSHKWPIHQEWRGTDPSPHNHSWGWRENNQWCFSTYCCILGSGSGAPVTLLQMIQFPSKTMSPLWQARTSIQQVTTQECGTLWLSSSPTCWMRPTPLTTRVQRNLWRVAHQTKGHQGDHEQR